MDLSGCGHLSGFLKCINRAPSSLLRARPLRATSLRSSFNRRLSGLQQPPSQPCSCNYSNLDGKFFPPHVAGRGEELRVCLAAGDGIFHSAVPGEETHSLFVLIHTGLGASIPPGTTAQSPRSPIITQAPEMANLDE